MAGFWDVGGTPGLYEPQFGDFPIVEIRGCDDLSNLQTPDEIIFWIINDAGGEHANSLGDPIGMEIQATAFAYDTYDQLDDMTFYSYRLINRSIEEIDSFSIALWVDPDLGCYTDDYVGCDPERNLSYFYNADAIDGDDNCECNGTSTYCNDIPVLGIDFMRGPLNEFGEEISMSSFTYYMSSPFIDIPSTDQPLLPNHYFNYMNARWRDGTPLTYGGLGYNPLSNDFTSFAFPSPPNDPNGWSLCSENIGPENDYRYIQSAGPFTLKPGAINELIMGVIYTPSMDYPCPDLTRFFETDDYAQALFNGCIDYLVGPNAPEANWVELDKELIVNLSNENEFSNNYKENYEGLDLIYLKSEEEYLFKFEGYQIYQLPDENQPTDLLDPDQARLVAQVDIKNGIKEIYNWHPIENPNANLPGEAKAIWEPIQQVDGADEGLKHSFQINEDQFATGDRALINHRDYYFTVVAYAYNNWKDFTQKNGLPEGQRSPYYPGNNLIYKVTPRPIVDVRLSSKYGEGPLITRLDGKGIGSKFVEISEETREDILQGNFNGEILYEPGQGPIDVFINNPLIIKDESYTLYFKDSSPNDDTVAMDAKWELVNNTSNEVIAADQSIATLNEQIIADYGFSIAIEQTQEAGALQEGNGALGIEVEYADPQGRQWFAGIPDSPPPFDWIRTASGEEDNALDPAADFVNNMAPGYWQPYPLTNYRYASSDFFMISPAWDNSLNSQQLRLRTKNDKLNNVDIVFTADKSKWSRCIVVETASRFQSLDPSLRKPTEGGAEMLEIREAESVGKYDSDGDGLPDPDGTDKKGFGWFPGYAIDVETGERLNVFFGENSTYDCAALQAVDQGDYCDLIPSVGGDKGIGRDMLWNPTDDLYIDVPQKTNLPNDIYPYIAGGQHFIYVTDETYDGCQNLYDGIFDRIPNERKEVLKRIVWTCFPMTNSSGLLPLGSGKEGLIPNDVTFKLRVDNPYQVATGTGINQGHPAYQFSFEGKEAQTLTTKDEFAEELAQINVVPNPYYGYSYYETTTDNTTVKITNLPPRCEVSIYSLDGKFIRNFQRNEDLIQQKCSSTASNQLAPALEWNLKNRKGLRIASGMYLIHVDAKEKGERVLKFFAAQRQSDG